MIAIRTKGSPAAALCRLSIAAGLPPLAWETLSVREFAELLARRRSS